MVKHCVTCECEVDRVCCFRARAVLKVTVRMTMLITAALIAIIVGYGVSHLFYEWGLALYGIIMTILSLLGILVLLNNIFVDYEMFLFVMTLFGRLIQYSIESCMFGLVRFCLLFDPRRYVRPEHPIRRPSIQLERVMLDSPRESGKVYKEETPPPLPEKRGSIFGGNVSPQASSPLCDITGKSEHKLSTSSGAKHKFSPTFTASEASTKTSTAVRCLFPDSLQADTSSSAMHLSSGRIIDTSNRNDSIIQQDLSIKVSVSTPPKSGDKTKQSPSSDPRRSSISPVPSSDPRRSSISPLPSSDPRRPSTSPLPSDPRRPSTSHLPSSDPIHLSANMGASSDPRAQITNPGTSFSDPRLPESSTEPTISESGQLQTMQDVFFTVPKLPNTSPVTSFSRQPKSSSTAFVMDPMPHGGSTTLPFTKHGSVETPQIASPDSMQPKFNPGATASNSMVPRQSYLPFQMRPEWPRTSHIASTINPLDSTQRKTNQGATGSDSMVSKQSYMPFQMRPEWPRASHVASSINPQHPKSSYLPSDSNQPESCEIASSAGSVQAEATPLSTSFGYVVETRREIPIELDFTHIEVSDNMLEESALRDKKSSEAKSAQTKSDQPKPVLGSPSRIEVYTSSSKKDESEEAKKDESEEAKKYESEGAKKDESEGARKYRKKKKSKKGGKK